MAAIDVVLTWIHVLGAVIFIGAMFLATFVLMPTLKAHVAHNARHSLMVHFIPRVRGIMRVVVTMIVLTGVGRALLLHFTADAPASSERMALFVLKLMFAAVPVAIFLLAPRVLGVKSKDGLCCDPDADDTTIKAGGVLTSTGDLLHYVAIFGGWAAILMGIILSHMR